MNMKNQNLVFCFLFFYPEVAGCCWRAAKHHGRCLSSIQASYWSARTTTCKFNRIRNQTAVAWHPVAKRGNCREKEECWGEGSYVKYFTCAIFFPTVWEFIIVTLSAEGHFLKLKLVYILSYISLNVQEDLEQCKLFHAQLEVLKKQMQDLQQKLKAGKDNTDSVKVRRTHYCLHPCTLY